MCPKLSAVLVGGVSVLSTVMWGVSLLNIGICVAFMCVCDICECVFASVYVHTHVGVSVCMYDVYECVESVYV